ncbi:hypothetical protein [Pseudomonas sichuanensis]|uniref:hypothetical protein n=1 Tax=Pseudomonas sichuanensis TaxID=2213015 RepID=UPI001300796F|nr:hypothetical protein [Pseudomonas sichuanensis]
MKPTDKAALVAAACGIAVGTLVALAPIETAWWVPILFGAFVGGGVHQGITKNMAAERIANGDFPVKEKS